MKDGLRGCGRLGYAQFDVRKARFLQCFIIVRANAQADVERVGEFQAHESSRGSEAAILTWERHKIDVSLTRDAYAERLIAIFVDPF